jgi:hypothetical protein
MPVITSTAGWSDTDFDARLQRGSHTSTTHEKVSGRCFRMKLFANVVVSRVSNISAAFACPPLGCVPQRDRRPRLIVDLSFYGVNADTVGRS